MVGMMRVLLEDRRRREWELAEERQKWEEERRRRDLEFDEERHRRQEETSRREEQTHQQMQVLQSLVEGVQLQGEAARRRAETDKDVKVAKLTEEDDIVSYLTMFERIMVAFEVKRERWAYKLASKLCGKAQKAYAALSPAEAGDYDQLKRAILRRYDITDESYRQRFRSGRRGKEESNHELVARLNDLAGKWLKEKRSREQVIDQIILEQFLKTLPEDIRVFVRERSPGSSEEAAKLADDYLQARKEELVSHDGNKKGDKRCLRCGKTGHLIKDCRIPLSKLPREQEKSSEGFSGSYGNRDRFGGGNGSRPADRFGSYDRFGGGNGSRPTDRFGSSSGRPRRDLKDIECHNCHKKGHYSSNCPQNAMLCTERQVKRGVISEMKTQQGITQPGVLKSGVVEGKFVGDILLDTGCSRTLVHQKLVLEDKLKDAGAVAIHCAHGDTVLYPLADISLEVNGKQIAVEAAVSDTLPMSANLPCQPTEEVGDTKCVGSDGARSRRRRNQ